MFAFYAAVVAKGAFQWAIDTFDAQTQARLNIGCMDP